MSKCTHASQFIDRISKATYPDESSFTPQGIEIDSTISTDTYESLTDSQISSLITNNHNMWKSGQTALFRHDSNIYIKATIVEALPFDPLSKCPRHIFSISRQEMSR